MTVYDAHAMIFTPPSNDITNDITTESHSVGPTIDHSLLFGPLFSASAAICNHSLTIVRVYGLQTLEAWFGCLEPLLPSFSPSELVSIVLPKLRLLSSLLIGTWSHPSKTVNHMVSTHLLYILSTHYLNSLSHARFQHILFILTALHTLSIPSSLSPPPLSPSFHTHLNPSFHTTFHAQVPIVYQRLIEVVHVTTSIPTLVDHAPLYWEHFVAEAIAQPSQHRARYQALSTLLPHVGAATILQVYPYVNIYPCADYYPPSIYSISFSNITILHINLIH